MSIGQVEEAAATFDTALERATAEGHELGRAFLLSKYGVAADEAGDHQVAVEFHHAGREIFVKRGDLGGQGYTLSRLSQTHYRMGEYDLALRYALDGLEKFEEMNHRWGVAVSHGRAGFAKIELGHITGAIEHFVECLNVATASGLGDQLHYGSIGIARAALAAGSDDDATEILRFEATVDGNPYADHAQVASVEGTSSIGSVEESVERALQLADRIVWTRPIPSGGVTPPQADTPP